MPPLLKAEKLILLTDVEGVQDENKKILLTLDAKQAALDGAR
jgi:acetylglutamate kinase